MTDTPLPDALDFQKNKSADPARMNLMTTAVHVRLLALEAQRAGLDDVIASLESIGLQRIDEVIQPLFAVEQARVATGVLIANSETVATATPGQTLQFAVDAAEWATFSPSALVSLTRTSNTTDSAVLRTVSYDPKSGTYICTVVSQRGSPGPFADWQLSATAGASIAMSQILAQVVAARDIVTAAAAVVAQQEAAVAAINARFTVSSQAPSGGNDGDVWLKY